MSVFVIVSTKQAVVLMVDANIQREEILPNERTFAFKMKLEAFRRQGARTDLTSGHHIPKLSMDVIGDESVMTGRQVKRYIRLTELMPELLDYVDEKKIGFVMDVEIVKNIVTDESLFALWASTLLYERRLFLVAECLCRMNQRSIFKS